LFIDSNELAVIALSLRVGLLCVLISFPFALLFGWILVRKSFPGKVFLEGFLSLPLVLPPVIVGYLLLLLLGVEGVFGQWLFRWFHVRLAFTSTAAVIASIVVSFPLFVRSVRIAIGLVDTRLEEAARTLGLSPLMVFFKITLPLSKSGVIGGAVLCFARSLGEFGATIAFAGNIQGETRTIPLAVYSYMQVPGREGAAFRLVLISVLVSLAALAVSELSSRRNYRLKERR